MGHGGCRGVMEAHRDRGRNNSYMKIYGVGFGVSGWEVCHVGRVRNDFEKDMESESESGVIQRFPRNHLSTVIHWW